MSKLLLLLICGVLVSGMTVPQRRGVKEGEFLVEPERVSFVEPVRINERQINLLRQAALGLQQRLRTIPSELEGTLSSFSHDKDVLMRHINQGIANLNIIHAQFDRLTERDQVKEASKVYFGDIANYYLNTKDLLMGANQDKLTLIRDRTIWTLNHNRIAYVVVADAGSETFDLDVKSSPKEATVKYKRKGDPYIEHSEGTNTTIKNLVYAIWYVQAHLARFPDQEKQHNPYQDSKHEIEFDFK